MRRKILMILAAVFTENSFVGESRTLSDETAGNQECMRKNYLEGKLVKVFLYEKN